MLYLDVGLGQVHVDLRHLQRRVAQDQPQGHDIAAVHQIAHRKGVAEEVCVQAGYVGAQSEPANDQGQSVVGQGGSFHRKKHGVALVAGSL